jgi:type I restriction enzyme M protein
MSSNLQSITSTLWAMANELRGNMDAGEFKNYILAFMFYRYLSEHQKAYLVSN